MNSFLVLPRNRSKTHSARAGEPNGRAPGHRRPCTAFGQKQGAAAAVFKRGGQKAETWIVDVVFNGLSILLLFYYFFKVVFQIV